MPAPHRKSGRKREEGQIPRHEDCWAKTTKYNEPGLSVRDHCLNVGCVAEELTERLPQFLKAVLHVRYAPILAALHDVGKVSPGFQCKCDAWLVKLGSGILPSGNAGPTARRVIQGQASSAFRQCSTDLNCTCGLQLSAPITESCWACGFHSSSIGRSPGSARLCRGGSRSLTVPGVTYAACRGSGSISGSGSQSDSVPIAIATPIPIPDYLVEARTALWLVTGLGRDQTPLRGRDP